MLRVRLREHHQLDVSRVAAQRLVVLQQVVDLVRRQRQTQLAVGRLEGGAAAADQVDLRQRRRLSTPEQAFGLLDAGEHRFGHAVVDQRQQQRPLVIAERAL